MTLPVLSSAAAAAASVWGWELVGPAFPSCWVSFSVWPVFGIFHTFLFSERTDRGH